MLRRWLDPSCVIQEDAYYQTILSQTQATLRQKLSTLNGFSTATEEDVRAYAHLMTLQDRRKAAARPRLLQQFAALAAWSTVAFVNPVAGAIGGIMHAGLLWLRDIQSDVGYQKEHEIQIVFGIQRDSESYEECVRLIEYYQVLLSRPVSLFKQNNPNNYREFNEYAKVHKNGLITAFRRELACRANLGISDTTPYILVRNPEIRTDILYNLLTTIPNPKS